MYVNLVDFMIDYYLIFYLCLIWLIVGDSDDSSSQSDDDSSESYTSQSSNEFGILFNYEATCGNFDLSDIII